MSDGNGRLDKAALVEKIEAELFEIRSAKGRLTPQKLGDYQTLVEILGADDLLDAFMAFRRELRRYVETANRNEAAAALSILVDHETVLDRLQETASRLSPDDLADQRTARRWSDAGMSVLARDLVYMAEVQGRLGREMLSIGIDLAATGDLIVTVQQLLQVDMTARAPELSLWAMDANGDPHELSIDFQQFPASEAAGDDYRMRVQRVSISVDLLDRITPDQGLTLAVTGRDAPMRTISFEPNEVAIPGLRVAFSAYRMRAAVELSREP